MRRPFLFVLATLCALAGCRGKQRTMLVVEVDSSLAVPGEMDKVDVAVSANGKTQHMLYPLVDGYALPLYTVLVETTDIAGTLDIVATGLLNSIPVVSEEAIVGFVEGQSRLLRLFLAAECRSDQCTDPTKTCTTNGACVDKVRNPGDLPVFDPGTIRKRADAGSAEIGDAAPAGDTAVDTWKSETGAERPADQAAAVFGRDVPPEVQADVAVVRLGLDAAPDFQRPLPDVAPPSADAAADQQQTSPDVVLPNPDRSVLPDTMPPPHDTAPPPPDTPSVADASSDLALVPYGLTVSKTGTGGGSVTSSPGGIVCGGTCSASFTAATVVTLTAVADSASAFTGWSGACSGTGGTCSVTVDAAKLVTANFNLVQYSLTVSKTGAGGGGITSSPAGINCGATCTASFTTGAIVTLTPAADGASTFTGWTGACSGIGPCTVTMNAASSVTANFNVVQNGLNVAKTGTGDGTVTSSPSGINCGPTCSFNFASGTVVTLTAAPGGTSTFTGWSGACSGNGPCTVTMGSASSVTANFDVVQNGLSVAKTGTGGGTVTSSPSGINCGPTCSFNFASGTVVTLTAAPGGTSTFMGWSGACSGTGTCSVTMDTAESVSANFNVIQFGLAVSKNGTGGGTVTSSPSGINCGATCTASFTTGAIVTLTPTADGASTFTGWSGACSGTGPCTVTMGSANSVTANFAAVLYSLSVNKAGTGGGTVSSSPSGIACGNTCSASYTSGTVVTLTATPDGTSTFTGWTGACSGTGTCSVTMSAGQTLTANFGALYTQISGGSSYACGLRIDGTIYCWGESGSGQNNTSPSGTFSSVSAGYNFTCGLETDSTVACWGALEDNYGQATPPSGTFSSVSAGFDFTCGVKTDGTVACWGVPGNDYGQATPPSGTFSSVSAGFEHTCGVRTDGTVACWGNNGYGQATPLSGTFSSASTASFSTCGVKTDGTVACWGVTDPSLGAPGVVTPPSGTFSSISASGHAGGSHTCGVKMSGTIACWGDNTYGQSTPPSGTFTSVGTGGMFTCGVKTDGSLLCWGYYP